MHREMQGSTGVDWCHKDPLWYPFVLTRNGPTESGLKRTHGLAEEINLARIFEADLKFAVFPGVFPPGVVLQCPDKP